MTRPLGKVYEEVCLAGLHGKSVVQVAVLLAACLSPIQVVAQNDIWKGVRETGAMPANGARAFLRERAMPLLITGTEPLPRSRWTSMAWPLISPSIPMTA